MNKNKVRNDKPFENVAVFIRTNSIAKENKIKSKIIAYCLKNNYLIKYMCCESNNEEKYSNNVFKICRKRSIKKIIIFNFDTLGKSINEIVLYLDFFNEKRKIIEVVNNNIKLKVLVSGIFSYVSTCLLNLMDFKNKNSYKFGSEINFKENYNKEER